MDIDERSPQALADVTGAPDVPPDAAAVESTGFDPGFLGVPATMPTMPDQQAAASVELAYEHFTVMLDTTRRFAGVTGVVEFTRRWLKGELQHVKH